MERLSIDEIIEIFRCLTSRDALSFGLTCKIAYGAYNEFYFEHWITLNLFRPNFICHFPQFFYRTLFIQVTSKILKSELPINLIKNIVGATSFDRPEESPLNLKAPSYCQIMRDEIVNSTRNQNSSNAYESYSGGLCFRIQLQCGCAQNMSCYWSSSPTSKKDQIELISVNLKSPISLVVGFSLTPYQAFFQPGSPCFAPQEVEILFTLPNSPSPSPTTPLSLTDSIYFISQPFLIANFAKKQFFYFPLPVLCFGGCVWVRCRGMQTRQPIQGADDYYCCLSHVSIQGYSLDLASTSSFYPSSSSSSSSTSSSSLSSTSSISPPSSSSASPLVEIDSQVKKQQLGLETPSSKPFIKDCSCSGGGAEGEGEGGSYSEVSESESPSPSPSPSTPIGTSKSQSERIPFKGLEMRLLRASCPSQATMNIHSSPSRTFELNERERAASEGTTDENQKKNGGKKENIRERKVAHSLPSHESVGEGVAQRNHDDKALFQMKKEGAQKEILSLLSLHASHCTTYESSSREGELKNADGEGKEKEGIREGRRGNQFLQGTVAARLSRDGEADSEIHFLWIRAPPPSTSASPPSPLHPPLSSTFPTSVPPLFVLPLTEEDQSDLPSEKEEEEEGEIAPSVTYSPTLPLLCLIFVYVLFAILNFFHSIL